MLKSPDKLHQLRKIQKQNANPRAGFDNRCGKVGIDIRGRIPIIFAARNDANQKTIFGKIIPPLP
jgi:hypothetical protein